MKKIGTKQMVESGILLTLGFVLSLVKVKLFPQGGSVTAVSMLPIVVLAVKYGPAWGTLCGCIHALLQVIEDGGFFPPVQNLSSYLLVFLLDFLIAWGIIGLLAGLCRNVSKRPGVAVAVGSAAGLAGRYLSSTLSGIIIWSYYAPEGVNVPLWSLAQNGMYMIPEMVFTAVAGMALFSVPVLARQIRPEQPENAA